MSPPSARIRVYLLTYRRPSMLRRALESLCAQNFTNWICELHNDAPDDLSPVALVAEFADPRISLHTHARNLGAVATFNLAHAGAPEPFFTILEDDNWWEPGFLAYMLSVLEARPEAEIAWANMRLWRETGSSGWLDTGETTWPVIDRPHVTIAWPQLIQFDGPLYSNGAMLARSVVGARLQLSLHTPFSLTENLRERAFRYPLVLVPAVLANFALTLETTRTSGRAPWVQAQTLIGAAFLRHVALSSAEQATLWRARRTAMPPAISGLFFAVFLQPTRGFLRHATLSDWFFFVRGCVRHPRTAFAALRARRQRPELWAEVDRATAAACANSQLPADIAPAQLASRADLPP